MTLFAMVMPAILGLCGFWLGHELALRRSRRILEAAETLFSTLTPLTSLQATLELNQTQLKLLVSQLDKMDSTLGNLTVAFVQRGLLRSKRSEEMVGETPELPRTPGWGNPPAIPVIPPPRAPVPSSDALT